MFKNYILISLRNLQRHFSYALINIFGLALGLAISLLLATWLRHEISYDRFHAHADRIYRVSMEYSFGGQVAKPSVSPNALLPAMLSLPEAESGVRVYNPSQYSHYRVQYGERNFEENKFYFADSTFFSVFTFTLIAGNPIKALSEPYSVVLTRKTAKKYFGDEDPIGKTIVVNNTREYTVTGIVENPPTNSLLQFDFIASFYSIPAGREDPTWWSANYQTFVLIHSQRNLPSIIDKTNAIAREAVAGELEGEGNYVRYNFLPLTDIYLRSEFEEAEKVSDIKYIYIFSAVTLLVLIIACINYINLATARSVHRAREVGIRKISGALKKQLFVQFMGEAFILTVIAFILSLFTALILLSFFNQLTGKNFTSSDLFDPSFIAWAILGVVGITLMAGGYPAFALTGFAPVQVLKGNFRNSGRGIWLRKSLVVFQFGISAILITATLVVTRQLDFIRSKNLGFDRENTIVLPFDDKVGKSFEVLKTELKRSAAAIHVGRGSESPTQIRAGYSLSNSEDQGRGIIVTGLLTDEEYLPALGLTLSVGRNFTREDVERMARDTVLTFLLNEAALAELYLEPEEAIGKKVIMMGRPGEVIGVVKDFHYSSLHNPIGPLVIFPENQFQKIFVRLPPGDISENLEKVRNVWRSLIDHRPFEFEFIDRQYAALYQAEERMGSIATVFSVLAVLIACLGLFGLASFSAEQKKRDIGIRKVMGATPSGIVLLISRDFSKLVIVAILLGLPLAWWIMSHFWLNEFAYKAHIGIIPFLLAAVLCFLIAFLATGYQALKASWIEPAELLRNE